MNGIDLLRVERGTIAKVARHLGIKASAVSMWTRVPAERLPAVSEITGIPRHELRPDICPAPEPATT